MAKKLYEESLIQDIANAIREKNGETTTYKIGEMGAAIKALSGETETYTFSQERTEVSKFLREVTYNPADYTISSIPNYVTTTSSNHPEGVSIQIKKAGSLVITDGNTNNTITKAVQAGAIKIYNLTPNIISTFFVIDSNNKIIQQGTIKPTGTCRMIYMTNVDNVRDIGGWSCDGGTIKYGKLFRGGDVYGVLTEDGATQALDMLGIEKEIDLRFDSDLNGRTESGFGNSVDMLHVDMTWNDLNYQKNSGNIKKIFDQLFDYVIAGHPTYFHCSAGADRTGVVALLCEAVLGMSQSDMDKEYELTCFYSGVENDSQARRRNEAIWTREINIINSYSGATFRDKAVNYMVSCGITIEKINAFRAAMINGTPDILTADINTYTVTKTLTNITTDNNATSAKQYQPYIAKILPDDGKIIENVKVTMGGTDITSAVFDGNVTVLRRVITKNLTQCTSSNTRTYAISGQSYVTNLTANEGYDIDSVSITMGGVDVSTFYKDGIVSIPEVTGDIVITATAITQGPAYTNQIPISTDSTGAIYNNIGYKDGYQISDSGVDEELGHKSVTGFIPIKKGDTIRIKGVYNNDVTSCRMCAYNSSKAFETARNGTIFASTGVYSLSGDVMTYTPNEYFVTDTTRYFRFSCDTGAHTGEEDGSKLIITINEEIV
jgi:hypothetical protein